MRTCRDFMAVMRAYPKGQLEPAVTRALDEHLADCPRCLDFLAEELITAYREAAEHMAPNAVPTTGAGSALR